MWQERGEEKLKNENDEDNNQNWNKTIAIRSIKMKDNELFIVTAEFSYWVNLTRKIFHRQMIIKKEMWVPWKNTSLRMHHGNPKKHKNIVKFFILPKTLKINSEKKNFAHFRHARIIDSHGPWTFSQPEIINFDKISPGLNDPVYQARFM